VSRIIFITGTDTGVGKTVFTSLLLIHLRNAGVKALAMKPFCSGGTQDLEVYRGIQGEELPPKLLNPYYFPEPLAPLIAARKAHRRIYLSAVIRTIRAAQEGCECLLVEGAGGVLVPIAKGLMLADLIAALKCEVLLVARDKIGTLNHTFLSIEALRHRGARNIKVILVGQARPDMSSRDNGRCIAKTIENIDVFSIGYSKRVAKNSLTKAGCAKKLKKTLARIMRPDSFTSVVRNAAKAAKRKTGKRKLNR
jgi:dethiobiotin synthetase